VHASRTEKLLLASLWMLLTACGRLGYELHDLDAGPAQTVTGSSNTTAGAGARAPAANGGGSAARAMDAGMRPTSSLPGAWRPDAGSRLPNAAACSDDAQCASGACVTGMCCESRCDSPASCYVADAASCSQGHCQYRAAEDGEACDDANSCTQGDHCERGACTGRAACDDDDSCTSDFCAPGECAHRSACQPEDAACSYGQHAGHGYWLCPGPVSFDAARAECKRIGAKLVTIDDASEQAALWQLGMRDAWIGFRAQTSEDDADAGFTWVDGDSDFEAWAEDDLDAGTPDRCVFQSEAERGAWQSRACDDAFAGFACEVEAYAAPEPDCSYQRRGTHGYYHCKSLATWREAEQRCKASGAYLVELDNAEEQAFVLGQIASDAPHTAIGVSDADREGEFVTTRGGRLTFSAWRDDQTPQPDASNTDSDYGVLAPDGTWQTVSSDPRGYYICEQEP
jgi:hypothetical protein